MPHFRISETWHRIPGVRIIAGSARGRRLAAPKGGSTRPTPDRVREALFSMLAPELPGASVLDLFAGTGALGIESLSRGARLAVFVESDRRTVALLKVNLAVLGDSDARVLSMLAAHALQVLARERAVFDVIFLDPPFESDLLASSLVALAGLGLLAPAGVVVCEHASHHEPPEPPEGWKCAETRRFGDVALSLYRAKKGKLT